MILNYSKDKCTDDPGDTQTEFSASPLQLKFASIYLVKAPRSVEDDTEVFSDSRNQEGPQSWYYGMIMTIVWMDAVASKQQPLSLSSFFLLLFYYLPRHRYPAKFHVAGG
jgi:hypothetical protein